MVGMSNRTGKPLDGLVHLAQSIRNILTTPIGTRVMLRNYGSGIFDLVDAPLNGETIVKFYAATAVALDQWEPRLKLIRIGLEIVEPGKAVLYVEGIYLPDGREIRLPVIESEDPSYAHSEWESGFMFPQVDQSVISDAVKKLGEELPPLSVTDRITDESLNRQAVNLDEKIQALQAILQVFAWTNE